MDFTGGVSELLALEQGAGAETSQQLFTRLEQEVRPRVPGHRTCLVTCTCQLRDQSLVCCAVRGAEAGQQVTNQIPVFSHVTQ